MRSETLSWFFPKRIFILDFYLNSRINKFQVFNLNKHVIKRAFKNFSFYRNIDLVIQGPLIYQIIAQAEIIV